MTRNETAERRQTVGIGEIYVATNFVNRHTTANCRGQLKEPLLNVKKSCFEDVIVEFHRHL